MNNNFVKILGCTFLGLAVSGEAAADDIVTNTARMQAMDKITGRVSMIDVPVNGLANFGTFSILVRKCVTKSPEETPENTAFVDVVDNYKTDEPVNIFKGWMFSSTPALNAVEHPIYDVWLLKCYNSQKSGANILTEEQLALRDTIPMVRHEKVEQTIDLAIVDEAKEDVKDEDLQPKSEAEDESEQSSVKIDINSNDNVADVEEEFASEGEEFVGDLVEEKQEVLPETDDTDTTSNDDEPKDKPKEEGN